MTYQALAQNDPHRPDPAFARSAFGDLARARGVLFDKDGTLFRFERGAGEFGQRLIHELAHGDKLLSRTLARTAGYDLREGRYSPDSMIVSGSWKALAARWAQDLPFWRADELEVWLQMEAASIAHTAQAPTASDLAGVLQRLAGAGLILGVATHDSEASARRQLEKAGAAGAIRFIAGNDSGFAPKPDRAMLDGFCAATGLTPDEVVVVGDTRQDMRMARAAGALAAIGVLSGPAEAETLAPEADLLLPSVSDLPDAFGV